MAISSTALFFYRARCGPEHSVIPHRFIVHTWSASGREGAVDGVSNALWWLKRFLRSAEKTRRVLSGEQVEALKGESEDVFFQEGTMHNRQSGNDCKLVVHSRWLFIRKFNASGFQRFATLKGCTPLGLCHRPFARLRAVIGVIAAIGQRENGNWAAVLWFTDFLMDMTNSQISLEYDTWGNTLA